MSIVGIYKITSPTGKVYIGQSWNIPQRWKSHRHKNYLKTPIAYSIKLHGEAAHLFQVAHELPGDVSQQVLDSYEQIYIDLYKDAGAHLLNAKGAGRSGKMPLEVVEKIRAANTGQKRTDEQRAKLSASFMSRPYHGQNNGKVRTPEVRALHSKIQSDRTDNKGEMHHMAKLTNEIVLSIRAKYIPKIYGCKKLAKEFGIGKDHVLDIINRKIWRHI